MTESEPDSKDSGRHNPGPETSLYLRINSSLQKAGFAGGVLIDDLWGTAGESAFSESLSLTLEESLSACSGEEKFIILDEVAQGGMGEVYRALDRDIGRPVAMKVMHKGASDENRARFAEEAQITGQLEHPNVVPIHELGVDPDGRLYFTMKMVRGKSLRDILDVLRENEKGAAEEYPLRRMLRYLLLACNGIMFAHSRGVIHRDLKPDNIMLGEFGEVLVMDWGLAKIRATRACKGATSPNAGESENPDGSTAPAPPSISPDECDVHSFRYDARLMTTKDGTVAGTPSYMSPEQARGEIEQIDERSDVYGLGAVLYEILTLSPPAFGSTETEILTRVKTGRIPPPEKRAPRRDIPPELSAIAMKALSLSPAERFDSTEEFRQALADYLDRTSPSANAEERLRMETGINRKAVIAIGITAATLCASFLWFWLSSNITNGELKDQLEKEMLRRIAAEQAAYNLTRNLRLLNKSRKYSRDAGELLGIPQKLPDTDGTPPSPPPAGE